MPSSSHPYYNLQNPNEIDYFHLPVHNHHDHPIYRHQSPLTPRGQWNTTRVSGKSSSGHRLASGSCLPFPIRLNPIPSLTWSTPTGGPPTLPLHSSIRQNSPNFRVNQMPQKLNGLKLEGPRFGHWKGRGWKWQGLSATSPVARRGFQVMKTWGRTEKRAREERGRWSEAR